MAERNGYNPSIVQDDLSRCYLCGRASGKLDRHEIFPGRNRDKSKYYGLWVVLCHDTCHLGLAHGDRSVAAMLKRQGQEKATIRYGWSVKRFTGIFGRSYV